MEKQFMEYQIKLKEEQEKRKKDVAEKFYNLLIKYDIDLKKIDWLIIEKEDPLLASILTTISTKTKGEKKRICTTFKRDFYELLEDDIEVLEKVLERKIYRTVKNKIVRRTTWEINFVDVR